MISSGINLVMTVIGFAVSTMFIVFVCSRLVCARIQLNASRPSFPTAASSSSSIRSDINIFERAIHGMEPAVVATFPRKKFSDDFFSPGEDSQCTVCLAEYQKKDILRILPYCKHYFHVTCIDIWLQQHSTCPVCRISLCSSPERKFTMQPISSAIIRSYDLESLGLHSDHCICTSHGHSSRISDNSRMEPIQEDQFASEQDAAAEAGDCSTTASIHVRIDIGHHDSEISLSRVHPIHDNP